MSQTTASPRPPRTDSTGSPRRPCRRTRPHPAPRPPRTDSTGSPRRPCRRTRPHPARTATDSTGSRAVATGRASRSSPPRPSSRRLSTASFRWTPPFSRTRAAVASSSESWGPPWPSPGSRPAPNSPRRRSCLTCASPRTRCTADPSSSPRCCPWRLRSRRARREPRESSHQDRRQSRPSREPGCHGCLRAGRDPLALRPRSRPGHPPPRPGDQLDALRRGCA